MSEKELDSSVNEYEEQYKSSNYVKQLQWDMAIGLQEVDNLKPSKYLEKLLDEEVEGNLTIKEVEKKLKEYYIEKENKNEINHNELECDFVSARIVELLNKDNFNNEINGEMVLVDFFAKWRGPCRMISPIVEELSNEINSVSFCKVDVDENNELASSLGILSIPTLLLYKQGKLVSKKIGFQSKDELKSWIEENK